MSSLPLVSILLLALFLLYSFPRHGDLNHLGMNIALKHSAFLSIKEYLKKTAHSLTQANGSFYLGAGLPADTAIPRLEQNVKLYVSEIKMIVASLQPQHNDNDCHSLHHQHIRAEG